MAPIELTEVVKDYRRGEMSVRALDGVTASVAAGEFVSIMGPSGSGKSTLLHLLGGLDHPTSGTVSIDGEDLAALPDRELTRFRRRRLGFVFQFFNLLPTLSAWENVALPRLLDGVPLRKTRDTAIEMLGTVGLGERVEHRPAELSGGQLQRVAIARALINEPVVLLADEPTGNLDSHTGEEILELFRRVTSDAGTTAVMVTHDRAAAAVGDRIVHLADGRIAEPEPEPAEPAESAPAAGNGDRIVELARHEQFMLGLTRALRQRVRRSRP
jgi:putative ABC transport system ATP-binding protein